MFINCTSCSLLSVFLFFTPNNSYYRNLFSFVLQLSFMSTFDIVGHYDRLVQELPENPGSVYVAAQPRSIESAEVNSAIFLRGKSLFTSKEVPQGEVVFVERKLVSIVEPSSAKFVSTCDYCMRALGSLEDQIRFASRILRKKGTAAPTKEDSLEIPFADEVRAYTAERVASEREANGMLMIFVFLLSYLLNFLKMIIFCLLIYFSILQLIRIVTPRRCLAHS